MKMTNIDQKILDKMKDAPHAMGRYAVLSRINRGASTLYTIEQVDRSLARLVRARLLQVNSAGYYEITASFWDLWEEKVEERA